MFDHVSIADLPERASSRVAEDRVAASAAPPTGLRHGVDVRVEAPAVRLSPDEAGVRGVVVGVDGAEHTVRATQGVLLASGGFESSAELSTAHLDAPFGTQVCPAGHDGIAVQLAEDVHAASRVWKEPGRGRA
jgi:hypothetical protein